MSLLHPVVALGSTPPTNLPTAFAAVNDALLALDSGVLVEAVNSAVVPSDTVLPVFPDFIVVTGSNAGTQSAPYVVRVPGGAARPLVNRSLIIKNLSTGWVRVAEDGADLTSIDTSGAILGPGRALLRITSGRGSFLAPSLHQSVSLIPMSGLSVGNTTATRAPIRTRIPPNDAGVIGSGSQDTMTIGDQIPRLRITLTAAFSGIQSGQVVTVGLNRWTDEAGTSGGAPLAFFQFGPSPTAQTLIGTFFANPTRTGGGRWLSFDLNAQSAGVVCTSLSIIVESVL